jgi:NADH dehydrogenase
MTGSAPESTSQHVVAVTGASGFVGRHVVRTLLTRGHKVRGLTTKSTKAWDALPEDDRLTVVEGDVLSSTTRNELLEGADAVIHLIGIHREIPRKGVTYERLHVRATEGIVESATAAGIRRFLHMSALGTRAEAVSDYHKTKWRAERAVRGSDLDWTIFRPSIIHGAEGEFIHMVQRWVTGHSPAFFVLPYFEPWDKPQDEQRPGERARATRVQPVYVGDIATAIVDAIDRPESFGEVYPLGGPDSMTWPSMLTTIRDNIPGANPSIRPWGVPVPVGLAVGYAVKTIGLSSLLPFSVDDVQMSAEDNTCSNAKAHAHLGFDPAPFAATLAEYADNLH